MIRKIMEKMAGIPENDRKVEKIHTRAAEQIASTTIVLRKLGKMQEVLVRKTTTYYIARAIGAIK